nr:MAG TPA: hypothetical protein [Caudoviricetes sp.]
MPRTRKLFIPIYRVTFVTSCSKCITNTFSSTK